VAALCALILLVPAAIALGHSLYMSNGAWVHHHTLNYTTCNSIDQDTGLNTQAGQARQSWATLTDLDLTSVSQCHPADPAQKAHIELIDGYYGDTGWRASAISSSNPADNASFHARHTHIQFNLTEIGSSYPAYDKRALACREIGKVIGIAATPTTQLGAEGQNNDCMSFWGNPDNQVSAAENPTNYTYTNLPGPHSTELVDDTYAALRPQIQLSGALNSAAASGELLTAASYGLHIIANQGQPAPEPPIVSIEVKVDGQRVFYNTQNCSSGPCTMTRDWTLSPDSYSDGPHTVQVIGADTLGITTTNALSIEIDRRGDIYHAKEYTGDPSQGGELLTEQWASSATGDSRTWETDSETTTTRSQIACPPPAPAGTQCAQMRQLTKLDGQEDAFVMYTGSSPDDANIAGRATILDPAGFNVPPTAYGSLSSALSSWQTPPPNHGSQYERYEFTRRENIDDIDTDQQPIPDNQVEFTDRIWVDAATKLPLKADSIGPTGTLGTTYFSYGGRLEPQTLPADFFAVGSTQNVVLDKAVTMLGSQPAGPQVDEETGETFVPLGLGDQPMIGGQGYCLLTTDTIQMDEEVPTAQPGDVAEDPLNAIDPNAAAAESSVDATYTAIGPSGNCAPGEGSADSPDLEVISEYKPAPDPTGWRQSYREAAEAIDADPEADPGSGGVMTVNVDGESLTAYAVAEINSPSADTDMSVLIVGNTQVTITGDFGESQIQSIADQLEPQ